MPGSISPTVIRRYIQLELRRLREAAGLSQAEAAQRLDTTKARIGHFETARNLPRLPDVEVLLPYYGAPELIEQFKELILQIRDAPPVFDLDPTLNLLPGVDMYVGLEQGASTMFTYDAILVNGILQCRTYAAAVIRGASIGDDPQPDVQVDAQVDLRMRRQAALDRIDPRLRITAVINEGVLHQRVGGEAVAADQLDYLLVLAGRDNVAIRVLPYAAGAHPGMQGPFTRLEFPIQRDPGVVYLEDVSGGRYLDDTENLDKYAAVRDRLMELALPEPQSLSLISKIRGEFAA